MSVLDASTRYSIPSIELRKPGLADPESERQTIVLGSGLTSKVVQYTIAEEDPVSLPSGTVVALKTFIRMSSSKMLRQAVYECIIREMEILCHPLLADHPNIVQLHFIGWRKGEAFPALAMELGAHGSLDYLIRSSWSGLTDAEAQHVRRHITIDIAMGLHAIHKAGFIHGDLKPENILVLSHASKSRRVVVKLTDFGGSSLSPGQDGGRPVHYTPLWCAPEVINKDPDIDWERADVYSYGLVVGSLWASHRGSGGFGAGRLDEPSSCFLTTYVQSTMTKEDEMDMFWFMKSEVDETSGKGVSSLLKNKLSVTVPDDMDRTQLFEVLASTLKAYFWLRPNTEGLGQSLQALAIRSRRNIWYVDLPPTPCSL
ncbi:kinase-like protein [Xylariaceae sp. AK1471]|nr:kinase-like protein [Xylariaceae sp. AK1471]